MREKRERKSEREERVRVREKRERKSEREERVRVREREGGGGWRGVTDRDRSLYFTTVHNFSCNRQRARMPR